MIGMWLLSASDVLINHAVDETEGHHVQISEIRVSLIDGRILENPVLCISNEMTERC
jgi:hypothetical protein